VAAKINDWDALTSLTVVVAVLLGLAFALLTPPFQFNDEHGHFARAYELSRGEVIGTRDPRLPSSVLATLLQYPEGYAPKSAPRTSVADLFDGRALHSTDSRPIVEGLKLNYLRWGLVAYQVYWPLSYLPASAGIRIAEVFDMSPLGMLYAARLLDVLSFVAALACALFLAPNHRALITAVALMPMTLQQTAAVSADGMTIAISLVGFALILRTREHPVSRYYLAALLVILPVWVLCKNSYWALPLLLLIPQSQFDDKKKRAAYILAATIVTIAAVVCWRELTQDAFEGFREAARSRGIDIYSNLRLLTSHLLQILRDTVTPHLTQFVGTFGWTFHPLPVRFPYLAMLLAVAVLELNPKPITIAERTILALVFIGAVLLSYFISFIIEGINKNGHYSFWSSGVQGRYMIPYCLAGLLPLKRAAAGVSSKRLRSIVFAASTVSALVCLAVIANFYYQ
jgi:uncharacterized membrane protein